MGALVARIGAECDFARVRGYLYTESVEDVDKLEAGARARLWAERCKLPLTRSARARLRSPDP